MFKNIEVVVSQYTTLSNEINSSLPSKTLVIQCFNLATPADIDKFLLEHNKITTLIIDSAIDKIHELVKLSQNIINLTKVSYSNSELKLNKPFGFSQFLNQLNLLRIQYDHKIFCHINNRFLFNTKDNILNFSKGLIVKLTQKETEILKALLLAPDYQLDKLSLLKKVWGLSSEIDTNTVETHISKLKQKCPSDFISIKDNIYALQIYYLH